MKTLNMLKLPSITHLRKFDFKKLHSITVYTFILHPSIWSISNHSYHSSKDVSVPKTQEGLNDMLKMKRLYIVFFFKNHVFPSLVAEQMNIN